MKRTTRMTALLSLAVAVLTLGPPAAGALTRTDLDLARAKAATARYNLPAAARAAGFVAEHECVYDEAGGMGVHWINESRFDGLVDPAEPEVLLYEPGGHGRPDRLVGVEYVAVAPVGAPPTLFGQRFAQGPEVGDGLAVHALHVWLWRSNPAGMFAATNPRVHCPA